MINYLLITIFIIIIIICLFLLYIKIKYRFWALQPVFHIYDLNYYLFPPGIIILDLPVKNKYTNFKNITTSVYSQLSDINVNKFTYCIKYLSYMK